MNRTLRGLAPVALLLALGCERTIAPPRQPFAAWEEGLTLIYEDPRLPEVARLQERLQVRVAKCTQLAEGRLVAETFTTLKSQSMATLLVRQDGGTALWDGQKIAAILLPPGFPDRVDRWTDRGVRYTVCGRALVDLPGLKLPDTLDPVGVWVEAEPVEGRGARRRILYMQGLGEVESRIFQDGRWVPVNRLVSRGFTDAASPGGH